MKIHNLIITSTIWVLWGGLICGTVVLNPDPVVLSTGQHGQYSPFDTALYFQPQTLTVDSDGEEQGSFFVTFSSGGLQNQESSIVIDGSVINPSTELQKDNFFRSASMGPNVLHYQLYKAQDVTTILKDPRVPLNSFNTIMGTFIKNQPIHLLFGYYFSVLPGQVVPAGQYQDKLKVQVYSGSPNQSQSAQLLAEQQLEIHIQVAKIVGTNWVSPAHSLSWSAHDLEQGQPKSVQLNIDANMGTKTMVFTESGGLMKGKGPDLPYGMKSAIEGNKVLISVNPGRVTENIQRGVRDTITISVDEEN